MENSDTLVGLAAIVVLCLALPPPRCLAQFHPPPIREKTGGLRAAGYLQLRYTALDEGEDRFAVRRLKLFLGGDMNRDWQWFAQFFFKHGNDSPADGRVYFQEGWIRFRRFRSVQFVAGQFKPAFGRERFTPDFEMYTIARSLVVRTLVPNGEFPESFTRDVGVQVDGVAGSRFRYAAGIFAGAGANRSIRGIGPMFTTRTTADLVRGRKLWGRPVKVNLGGSFSVRDADDLSFGTRGVSTTRKLLEQFTGVDRRIGLEGATDWSGWSLRTEYIRAWFDAREPMTADIAADGYYFQIAKFLAPQWQAAAKLEGFDPNKSLANSRDVRWLTLGLNYYIRDNRLKVMANYVFRWERVDRKPNDAVLIQFQWFFL